MEQTIKVFERNAPTGTVRTGNKFGTIWFAARDLLKQLGYGNGAAIMKKLAKHEYKTMLVDGSKKNGVH